MVTVVLALIVVGRLGRPVAPPPLTAVAVPETTVPQPPPPPVAMSPAPAVQPAPETPTLDLLVRLEARRRMQRAGGSVYLDSLLADNDSTLRRWPERLGQPVTIALVRDSLFEQADGGDAIVHDAFARWLALRLGVDVAFIADTTAAEIVVGWRDQFDPGEKKTGETALQIAFSGAIEHGRVTLALKDPAGKRVDRQAMLITAIHEAGHALGLAHSGNPADIMFPSPRSPALSERDRRTITLIYGLPPGSVKEQ